MTARMSEANLKEIAEAREAEAPSQKSGRSVMPLGRLFKAHQDELRQTLRRLFGDGPPEPDDIVQSAFSAMAKLKNTAEIENPKAYLFKVAINLARRGLKREATLRSYLESQTNFFGQEVEEISPERLLRARDALARIDAAIDALPPRQREIVVRSRLKGETYAMISEATGWSRAVVSRELNAALTALLKAADLGDDGVSP